MEIEEIKEEKKRKKFNLLAKLLKTTKSKIIFIIVLILIVIIAGLILKSRLFNKEASADFSYLSMLLEKSSELTTAKLKITGIEQDNADNTGTGKDPDIY